jgi:leucyl aminopeptidase
MSRPAEIRFHETDLDGLAAREGRIAVIVTPDGKLDRGARRVNSLTRKAVARLAESDRFEKAKTGDVMALDWPAGLTAEAVLVVKLPRRPAVDEARRAGAELAKARGTRDPQDRPRRGPRCGGHHGRQARGSGPRRRPHGRRGRGRLLYPRPRQ